MAIWELIETAIRNAHAEGQEWLTSGQIVDGVHAMEPTANVRSIQPDLRFHCINDRTKNSSPGLQYLRNPLLINDDPNKRGKRFRLLSEEERQAFLADRRKDLENFSDVEVMEWLAGSAELDAVEGDDDSPALPDEGDIVMTGSVLLEIHLQDYIHRSWDAVFPGLTLHEGERGREFRTADPGVGILDFLCVDKEGNYVVIETKKDLPDRRAIGQILGYMGWVQERLCSDETTVRGILVTGEVSDGLRMAAAAVPNLDLMTYEVSFSLRLA